MQQKQRRALPIVMGIVAVAVVAIFATLLVVRSRQTPAIHVGEKNVSVAIISQQDGYDQQYSFDTELETLGDLLIENDLVTAEESAYGRFITAAGGIPGGADDRYWMIYVDDKAAETGMDDIALEDGAAYRLALEKPDLPQ